MSDYTPTTEEVRNGYAAFWWPVGAGVQFDRWLAEVKAQVWEEGWRSRNSKHLSCDDNPYRQGEAE